MKKFYIVFCLLCTCILARTQEVEEKPLTWWIDPGIGTYTTFSNQPMFRLNIYSGFTVHKNKTFYKLRYMRNYEVEYFYGYEPSEYFNSINFLLGRGISEEKYHIQFSVGLGISSGVARKDLIEDNGGWIFFKSNIYEEDKFVRPSIPLEFEAVFKLTPYIGIGAGVFFEINFTKPVMGINSKVVLGKLR